MKIPSRRLLGLITCFALALSLGACDAGAISSVAHPLGASGNPARTENAHSIWPYFPSSKQPMDPTRVPTPDGNAHYVWPRRLALSDQRAKDVIVFGVQVGRVQRTMNFANATYGSTYDAKGNLYVATSKPDVEELSSSGVVVDTYSQGLFEPDYLTLDQKNDLYVSDWHGGNYGGVLVEYGPNSKIPIAQCNTGLADEGVAVDNSTGTVFVAGLQGFNNYPYGSSNIVEYKRSLLGCKAVTLGVASINWAGGLLVDKSKNLIVSDETRGVVDILPPPYDGSNERQIQTQGDPCYLALNADETLLFISDQAANDVLVVNYPGAKVVKLIDDRVQNHPSGLAVWNG